MKTIEMSTASKPLSEYASELDEDVVVLTLHDKPIAALVSLRDVDRESLSLSTNRDFLAIIDRAREEFREGRTLSLEEVKREVLP
jgi:hypothetical protein